MDYSAVGPNKTTLYCTLTTSVKFQSSQVLQALSEIVFGSKRWKNSSPGSFKFLPLDRQCCAASLLMSKKVLRRPEGGKENEPLTQTLVSTTFTFVPTLTEPLKPELRWLRDFIMCRGCQIHTGSRNMPSGGATPTLTISVHSCFFSFFFLSSPVNGVTPSHRWCQQLRWLSTSPERFERFPLEEEEEKKKRLSSFHFQTL